MTESLQVQGEGPNDSALATIQQFNAAFNRHDVDAIMALMTENCVFENTYPPPDGERFEGQMKVRAFWEQFFRAAPQAAFDFDEIVACGERAFVCWRYNWVNSDGQPGHIRGVDIMRVQDGKVAEKLSFVKG